LAVVESCSWAAADYSTEEEDGTTEEGDRADDGLLEESKILGDDPGMGDASVDSRHVVDSRNRVAYNDGEADVGVQAAHNRGRGDYGLRFDRMACIHNASYELDAC